MGLRHRLVLSRHPAHAASGDPGRLGSGPDGRLTGLFIPNPRYRAIEPCERPLGSYVHATAETNRDQWIVEIDPRAEDRFPDISDEMLRGWSYVDADRKVTDRFRPNARWIGDTTAGPSPYMST
jgi:hypothetical protein